MHVIKYICNRTIEDTVCLCLHVLLCALLSLEVLQAGAVKGLITVMADVKFIHYDDGPFTVRANILKK